MDFLNMDLPEENKNDKFPQLEKWFDFMNDQMKKIEDVHRKQKINNILIDNDIDLI